jgi:hypothetical protein
LFNNKENKVMKGNYYGKVCKRGCGHNPGPDEA